MTGSPPPAFARDRTTALLYAALGVFGALQVVPGLVTPALRDELGYGYTLASLHLSAFAALGIVSGLMAPRLDARWGRRSLVLLGLAGMAAGTAALAGGRAAGQTLAAAALAGLLGTLIIVAVQSALSDHHGDGRAVAFAESNVVASVGATSAPLVVAAAAAVLGSWRWGVAALGLSGLAVAVLVAHGPRVPQRAAHEPVQGAGGPLPAAARAGVALVFAAVVLEWCVSYWGATYLREVVGLRPAGAVAGMTGFFGAMLAGRFASGLLVRHFRVPRLVASGLAVTTAGLLLQAASSQPAPALAGLVLLGVGIAALFPLALALAVEAVPHRATTVSGHCVVAGSTAVLVGPLVVGRLADLVGLRNALAILPVAVAGAGALLYTVTTRRPAPAPDAAAGAGAHTGAPPGAA